VERERDRLLCGRECKVYEEGRAIGNGARLEAEQSFKGFDRNLNFGIILRREAFDEMFMLKWNELF
jgi:hypothetical protein